MCCGEIGTGIRRICAMEQEIDQSRHRVEAPDRLATRVTGVDRFQFTRGSTTRSRMSTSEHVVGLPECHSRLRNAAQPISATHPRRYAAATASSAVFVWHRRLISAGVVQSIECRSQPAVPAPPGHHDGRRRRRLHHRAGQRGGGRLKHAAASEGSRAR